jgi:hypothetical protein
MTHAERNAYWEAHFIEYQRQLEEQIRIAEQNQEIFDNFRANYINEFLQDIENIRRVASLMSDTEFMGNAINEAITDMYASQNVLWRDIPGVERPVPFMMFSATGADVMAFMQNNAAIKVNMLEAKGYYFCQTYQEFRFAGERPVYPRGVIGITAEGIPIVDSTPFEQLVMWQRSVNFRRTDGLSRRRLIEDVSGFMVRQVTINGAIYEIRDVQRNATVVDRYLFIDGIRRQRLLAGVNVTERGILGGFAFINSDPNRFVYLHLNINEFYVGYAAPTPFYGFSVWTTRITTEVPWSPPRPTQPELNIDLGTLNILQHLAEIKAQISALGAHADMGEDEIIFTVPVVVPEAFPGITQQEFADFQARLWENLDRTDLIMPGNEAVNVDRDALPQFPRTAQRGNVVNPPVAPEIDLSGIIAILTTQVRLQEFDTAISQEKLIAKGTMIGQQARTNEWLETIARDLAYTKAAVQDRTIEADRTLDWRPILDIPPLGGIFPFSIPWDLYQGIVAMFGTGQGEPPVFAIDLSDTILGVRFELDFAQFASFAVVIRWGIMGMFVVGLVKITGRLIQW